MIAFVEEQARLCGCGSSAEYVEALIRKEQDRLRLREALVEGLASEPATCADAAYFEELSSRVVTDYRFDDKGQSAGPWGIPRSGRQRRGC